MKLYTIGFTQKSARQFFSCLRENGIQRLIDIRISPQGQQWKSSTCEEAISHFRPASGRSA